MLVVLPIDALTPCVIMYARFDIPLNDIAVLFRELSQISQNKTSLHA
jgi:hypothetical protein